MSSDSPQQPASPPPAPSDSNITRLRSELRAEGLARKLLDAWVEDGSEKSARMLAALHDFHRPK
jgi:hypothetical protein